MPGRASGGARGKVSQPSSKVSQPGGRVGGQLSGGASGAASGPSRRGRLMASVTYLLLFLFGLLQAVIGSFQYSRGPVPVTSVCFALGIFVTCILSAWGMRTVVAGLMPGVGWFIAAFILATGTQGGSILITNSTAGEWFLFGGSIGAAAGCLVSYVRWTKVAQAGRAARRASR
jgi:hypothetical protein